MKRAALLVLAVAHGQTQRQEPRADVLRQIGGPL